MSLSPHFSLDELTYSEVAVRRGISNIPNAGERSNLQRLVDNLLEPTRELLGVPLSTNSGFRCPAVNVIVGGAHHSPHLDGRAADVVPIGMDLIDAFHRIKRSDLPFDQCILECNSWLHLSIAQVGADPRREVLLASGGPGNWVYQKVTA